MNYNYSLAAGIIPYVTINNFNYFLLGKEKYNGIWSGFIGNINTTDYSITNTAIREFNEETCSLYADYIPTITKKINNSTPVIIKKPRKNIYIYFVEFPPYFLNNSINYKFKKNMKLNKNKPEYLEKVKLSWFTRDSIITHNDIIPSLKNIIKDLKIN